MKRLLFLLVSLVISCCFFSCSQKLGYAVLLWSIPEENMSASDVVTVHIKSNINQVYVISSLKNPNKKIEVPLWQISKSESRSQAQEYADKMREHQYTYAQVLLDGLPVRSQSDNTTSSQRLYRLRKDEIIKVLEKGRHEVMTGTTDMEGDWLYVLTSDGTVGWCFSYNLNLYDERKDQVIAVASTDETDTVPDSILKARWEPQSYSAMVDKNQIQPEAYNPLWGFYIGTESGFTRIVLKDFDMSFPFSGITKESENTYRFNDTSLTMQLRKDNTLYVQFTDKSGKPKSFTFVQLKVNMADLVQQELDRRFAEYGQLYKNGPVFTSGSYGVLQLLQNGTFIWSGYQLLVPSIIPAGALNKGNVSITAFIHASLHSDYDGVLSFKFEGTDSIIYFLYKTEGEGLRLESVSPSNMKDSVVTKRNANPFILYFTASDTVGSF